MACSQSVQAKRRHVLATQMDELIPQSSLRALGQRQRDLLISTQAERLLTEKHPNHERKQRLDQVLDDLLYACKQHCRCNQIL